MVISQLATHSTTFSSHVSCALSQLFEAGRMPDSLWPLTSLLSCSSLIPKAVASSGPFILRSTELAPARNCGWFLFDDVVKPNNSIGPQLDAIWQTGYYRGIQHMLPSDTSAFMSVEALGKTIWIVPVPISMMPYSVAFGLKCGAIIDP